MSIEQFKIKILCFLTIVFFLFPVASYSFKNPIEHFFNREFKYADKIMELARLHPDSQELRELLKEELDHRKTNNNQKNDPELFDYTNEELRALIRRLAPFALFNL